MTIHRLTFIALAFVFASCGTSPPTHFFTLLPVAPVGNSVASPPFPVQVSAVHIPAVLDRSEMVRQANSNALSIRSEDRWGAPLGEMARNVLAQNLAERLPRGSVILPRAPAPSSAAHLVVNIATFREDADRRVRLNGSWTLLRGTPAEPVLQGNVSFEDQAAGDDAGSQAAAMSKLLGRLADDIASKLATAAPSHAARQILWRRWG